jgi:hypothetical protein
MSRMDAIAQNLLIEFCDREDFAHAEGNGSRDATMERHVREMIDWNAVAVLA